MNLDTTSLFVGPNERATISLLVNGETRTLDVEPQVALIDLLRDRLGLYGVKKGCDHGQCGACTVLIDGRRVNACLVLAIMLEGAEVVTVEGLGAPGRLSPMQAAFVARDAFQCGYCTPGQICSATALVAEARAMSGDEMADDEIREAMSGNLCRCGAYPNILAAIRDVLASGRRAVEAAE
ncbi:(2Fe-2S)-binding protein [Methylocella sp.]|uniref:(2Fe-2S)-binding protein n=1 Tax=Methylocella sp. TaxID=1978226 RepID=UPI0037835FAE